MTNSCTMKLEEAARDRVGPLEIVILASPEICIEPEGNPELAGFVGDAQVANTGQSPVTLTIFTGKTAFRTLRSSRVSEPGGPSAALSGPPLKPADVESQTVQLNPGQSIRLRSWGRHQSMISNATLDSRHLDGSDVTGPALRVRPFVVEYTLNLTVNGSQGLTRTYAIPVKAVLVQP